MNKTPKKDDNPFLSTDYGESLKEFYNLFKILSNIDNINFVFKPHTRNRIAGVDKKLLEILNKRYAIWSEIVSTNLTLAGKLKINKE